MFCDDCDRATHSFCLDPPIEHIPKGFVLFIIGKWSCCKNTTKKNSRSKLPRSNTKYVIASANSSPAKILKQDLESKKPASRARSPLRSQKVETNEHQEDVKRLTRSRSVSKEFFVNIKSESFSVKRIETPAKSNPPSRQPSPSKNKAIKTNDKNALISTPEINNKRTRKFNSTAMDVDSTPISNTTCEKNFPKSTIKKSKRPPQNEIISELNRKKIACNPRIKEIMWEEPPPKKIKLQPSSNTPKTKNLEIAINSCPERKQRNPKKITDLFQHKSKIKTSSPLENEIESAPELALCAPRSPDRHNFQKSLENVYTYM